MLVSLGLGSGVDHEEDQSDASKSASKNRSRSPGAENTLGQKPARRRLRSITGGRKDAIIY